MTIASLFSQHIGVAAVETHNSYFVRNFKEVFVILGKIETFSAMKQIGCVLHLGLNSSGGKFSKYMPTQIYRQIIVIVKQKHFLDISF